MMSGTMKEHKCTLEYYLQFAKQSEQPILLHVLTTKGKGYDIAIKNPEYFHGASPFDLATGKSTASSDVSDAPKYQDVMGQTLVKLAQKDKTIFGITAAMPSGTGRCTVCCRNGYFRISPGLRHLFDFPAKGL